MVKVRTALPDEFERVAAFYRRSAYKPSIARDDLFVLAVEQDRICGALRLVTEEGTAVLRGMRVAPDRQREGVGTRMLEHAAAILGERECYCIPHRRLRGFYGQVGFAEIALGEAPSVLQDRWKQYTDEFALDVILMRRLAGAS
jgi:GNAT superfamily N-acetyltransferase